MTAPLNVPSYLDNESEKALAETLTAAADKDSDAFLTALGEAAKARGMAQIAGAAGLGRESLYKALGPGANPGFKTVLAVLNALDLGLSITVKAPAGRHEPARHVAEALREAATEKIRKRRQTAVEAATASVIKFAVRQSRRKRRWKWKA